MIEWALVIPSFFSVFTKVIQALNAVSKNYIASVPISYLISICDVFVIGGVAHYGITWSTVNGLFLGGAIGNILAMFVHSKVFDKKDITGIDKLVRIIKRMK